MAPVYVVLARLRASNKGTYLLPGSYRSLDEISAYIPPSGPPLPLIIKCEEERQGDLEPLTAAINKVGGGDTMNSAQEFVKAVIEEVRDVKIWPDIPLFYGLLNSPSVRKYIAPDYASVVDRITGTKFYTLFTFPTFVHAFIYILAGGNNKLRQWNLHEWVAQAREKSTPTALTPSMKAAPSFDASPIPFSLARGTSKHQGKAKEGKLKNLSAEDEESETPYNPLDETRQRGKQRAAMPEEKQVTPAEPELGPRISVDFTLPSHLVPISYLNSSVVASSPAPFITLRTVQESPHTLLTSSSSSSTLHQINELQEDSRLPHLAMLYLRSHGWSDSVVDIVASTRYLPLSDFLTLMSRAMAMPLAEASFLWYIIQNSV